jgi:hypothetical protein
MHPDAPYFIILLCLKPNDFTCQGESDTYHSISMFAWANWGRTIVYYRNGSPYQPENGKIYYFHNHRLLGLESLEKSIEIVYRIFVKNGVFRM